MTRKQGKAAAKRRAQKSAESSAIATDSQSKGSDVDQGTSVGNETKEEKVLPSGYDTKTGELLYNSDPRLIGLSKDVVIITTIPQSVPRGEPQCVWIVNPSTKPKVLNATGYPARIPKPREDLYEVKSTPGMGEGLFAKRDIRRGEIIFAERPLLATPEFNMPRQGTTLLDLQKSLQENHSKAESLFEAAIARLPSESQADFKALATGFPSYGPLRGRVTTNNYHLRNLFDGSDSSANYKTVGKIASRINHSCVPNVKFYFKTNSFSMQFYALRDLKAGDQLFYSYCLVDRSLAQRRADLAPYGFECKCTCCLNATAETDQLRTTFRTQIEFFKETLINRPKVDTVALEAALKFEEEVLKEGLDAMDEYLVLLMAISAAYSKLGKGQEGRKYGVVMEKFQKFMLDEWKGIPIPQ